MCLSRDLVFVLSAAASACTLASEEPAPTQQGLTTCVVETEPGVADLEATPRGLVLATAEGAVVNVQRLHGTGCDLAAEGRPIVAEALLDVDAQERLYVFPTDVLSRIAAPSMPAGEARLGMVAKIDEFDVATKLLDPGRGIWSFGVAPSGDALWVTACGPNGIFAMDGMTPAITPPDTLWEQMPAVLTDARTFWSIGTLTCDPTQPLSADCGYELVRTTPEGSETFGSTLADHGDGLVYAELARCGSRVCGVYPRAVRVWNDSGAEELTITLADVGASEVERFASATGNAAGTYVLLTGGETSRVVFVAAPMAHAR